MDRYPNSAENKFGQYNSQKDHSYEYKKGKDKGEVFHIIAEIMERLQKDLKGFEEQIRNLKGKINEIREMDYNYISRLKEVKSDKNYSNLESIKIEEYYKKSL